jgi:hypothetical protein
MTLRSLLHNSHLTTIFAPGKLDCFIAMKKTFANKQYGPSVLEFNYHEHTCQLEIITLVGRCEILVPNCRDSDKHFSLLQKGINYDFKKLYGTSLLHNSHLTIRFALGKLDHFIVMKRTLASKQHGPSALGFD